MPRSRPLNVLVLLAAMLAPQLPRADAEAPATSGPAREPSSDARAPAREKEDARRAQVLVKGEGVEVTIGELEDALAQQGASARARYKDPEQLKQLVSNLVRVDLLAAEAERRGYAQNPAVRHTVKDSAAQALVRVEIDDKVSPQSIPVEDVRAYYSAHAADFHRDAMRRASLIALDSAEEARALLPEAKAADARGFAELAKVRSKDLETKAHGGDLGYFAREPLAAGGEPNVAAALRKATFALKEVGDTSPQPVALEGKFAIVRVTGERPARHIEFNDAAPSIRAKLWRERRQKGLDELFASLRARDKPQVFAERVELIRFDDMERRPSGFAPDPPARPATTPDAEPPPP